MVKIEKINWLSKEGLEAEVYISDGKFTLCSFSHPFNQKVGTEIKHSLFAFDTSNIIKSLENNFKAERISGTFSYYLTTELIDKANRKVQLGNIFIDIDNILPLDLKEGDFIAFRCERLDLIIA